MDDGSPALEVGFVIDAGGSFSELQQLQALMDTTEARVVAEAAKIERATSGMVKVAGGIASLKSFGPASTRELQSAAVAVASVEKAGERLVAQLERQNATFGKTRAELRAMKAEELALAAERQGNADLASRLRSQEQALFDQEFAAQRRAAEAAKAAAEDKALAAQQAVKAAEAEAVATRNAAAAFQAFEARARAGAQAMREAETAAAADAALLARLRAMLDPASAAQDRLNKELEEARRVMTAAGVGAEEMARAEALLTQRHGGVVASTGQVKAGMQQLSYNLNDVATMWSMNAKPMQIFASQAGQIIQAVQLMSGEAKGLLGFLGGPWGLALTTAAVALAPLVGRLFDTSDAAKKAEEGLKAFATRQSDIGNFIDATTGKLTEQNRVLVQNAILTRQKAIDDNRDAIKAGQENAFSTAKGLANPLTGGSLWSRIKASAAVAGGATVDMLRDADVARVVQQANGDLAKLDAGLQALGRRRPDLKPTILEVSNLAGSAVVAARENETLGKEIAALQGHGLAATKGAAGLIEKQVALATATTAVERAQAAYNLVKERGAAAEKAGSAALEQYRRDLTAAAGTLNAAQAAERAARDGKTAHAKATRELVAAQKDADKEANELSRYQDEMGRVLDGLLRKIDPVTAAWRDYAKVLQDIDELQEGGFVDPGTALRLSAEAARKRRTDVDRASSEQAAQFYQDQRIDPVADLRKIVDGLDNKHAADPLNLPGMLDSAIEDGFRGGFRDVTRSINAVADGMSALLGAGSPVVRALGELGRGAGIGAAVAGAVGGSKVVGALGGAIGGEVGKQFLTKGLTSISASLGPLAGPLGSIAGGMIASFAGSLLSSTKKASATIGAIGDQLGLIETVGNSAKREKAASTAANDLLGALADIAGQLGGSLGSAGRVSIGIRDDNYRVDPTGRGATKLKKGAIDFGEDQQAAIEYALRDLIADGAVVGLRDATSRLLNSGTDLNKQVQKALDFEGVFAALKQATDPVGFAVEQLDKQFAALRDTFREASASIEENAQLEQLYQLKRDAITREAEARLDDQRRLQAQLLEAQGDVAGALALNRQVELATTDANLRTLQQQVWAAEDAKEAADKVKQLRDAWKSVGDTILDEVKRIRGLSDTTGGNTFAGLLGQFNAANAAARAGDQDAAKNLPQLSKSLLDAAALAATSRQELDRVQAQTAATLEGTYAAISGLTGGDASSASTSALSTLSAAQAASGGSAANNNDLGARLDALREEVAGMRADNNAGNAAIAANTGRAAKKLDDVTGDTGGNAIAVMAVAK